MINIVVSHYVTTYCKSERYFRVNIPDILLKYVPVHLGGNQWTPSAGEHMASL